MRSFHALITATVAASLALAGISDPLAAQARTSRPDIVMRVPDSVLAGQAFTITGKLRVKARRPVVLQARVGSRWQSVGKGRSTKRGTFAIGTTAPSTPQALVVRARAPRAGAGKSRLAAVTTKSSTVTVASRSSTVSASAPSSLVAGESLVVRVSVSPGGSRPAALLEKVDGAWQTIVQDWTSSDGTGQLTHAPRVGTHTYRVHLPATGPWSGADSAPVEVQVLAKPVTRLQLVVIGLPDGTPADVDLVAPDGTVTHATAGTTVDDAASGEWTAVARPVRVGTETLHPVEQSSRTQVTTGQAGSVVVDYGVHIPETTTVASSPTIEDVDVVGDGIYDITLTPTSAAPAPPTQALSDRVRRQERYVDRNDVQTSGPTTCSQYLQGLLCQGNVFVSGVTPVAQQGLFGRVVSLTDPTHLRIDAAGVTLADAIPVGETSKAGGALAVERSGKLHSGNLTCTGTASATLESRLELTPTLKFSARFAGGNLAEASVLSRLDQTAHAEAVLSGKGQCQIAPFPLAPPRRLSPLTVQVGPVPVVFVPEVSLTASARAEVNGTARVAFAETASAEAGITYAQGSGFDTHRSYDSPTVQRIGPEFDGSASASAALTASIDFKLYGMAGPRLSAEASVSGSAAAHASPAGARLDWSVDASVRGYGQFRVDALGVKAESNELTFWGPFDRKLGSDSWSWDAPPGYLPSITSRALDPGSVGSAYSATLQTSDDREGRWAITSGSLPPGMSLDPDSGRLTGSPQAEGTFGFGVSFTDGFGSVAEVDLSLVVQPRPNDVMPDAFTGHPGTPDYYERLPVAQGRTGVWSIASGSLPPGLGITSGGHLTGRPGSAGVFAFTARLDGADGSTQLFDLRLAVVDIMMSSNCSYTPGKTAIVAGMGISERGLNPHQVRVTLNGTVAVEGTSTPTAPIGRFWSDLPNNTAYSVDLSVDGTGYHLDAFCP